MAKKILEFVYQNFQDAFSEKFLFKDLTYTETKMLKEIIKNCLEDGVLDVLFEKEDRKNFKNKYSKHLIDRTFEKFVNFNIFKENKGHFILNEELIFGFPS